MSQSIEHLALFNQLIRLSRLLEAKLMQELLNQGFAGLTMSFADPMMIITLGPVRMNELADELGMSKQLCNQSLKPLEQLNLIQRQADPADGRAKLVSLTARGEELAVAAQAIIAQLQAQLSVILGEEDSKQLHNFLFELAQGAQLRVNELVPTTGLISLLSRYTERQLMQLTMQQGFDFLQLSYSQILNYISPSQKNNVSLSELAQINHISLQAISRISRELEQHHIISKSNSNNDKRVKIIQLTELGTQLFHCSIESAQQLFSTYSSWINTDDLTTLTNYLTSANQHAGHLLNVNLYHKRPAINRKQRNDTDALLDSARILLGDSEPEKLTLLNNIELQQLNKLLRKLSLATT